VTSSPDLGAEAPPATGLPTARGQLTLLESEPLPPCSLCRSKSFRPGCARCESRRWLFLRPRPSPSMVALDVEAVDRARAAAERRERLAALGRPLRVALIGCGKRKLDRPAPAEHLYTGSLFRRALRFTEGRGESAELHRFPGRIQSTNWKSADDPLAAGAVTTDAPGHSLVRAIQDTFVQLRDTHTADDVRRTVVQTLHALAAVTLREGDGNPGMGRRAVLGA